eukprot:NODE_68_length_23780_cov_0.251003.p13 type:complete len:104 gc:universal NODE_68_length_23780_cov_0.251003:2616-2927(+)
MRIKMEYPKIAEYVQEQLGMLLDGIDEIKYENIENAETLKLLEPIELEYLDVLDLMKDHYAEMTKIQGKSMELAEMKMKWMCKGILKDLYATYSDLLEISKPK